MNEEREFDEMDFARAMFFSSDADFQAAKSAAAPSLKKSPYRSRMNGEEMKALRDIVRGFERLARLGPNHLRAAVNYIVSRYGKRVPA